MTVILEPRTRSARDAADRFGRVVNDFVDVLGNLAAVVAIDIHGQGRSYWCAGHVEREKITPASNTHAFQIGSQTKTLLAIALLRLSRLGRLDLDAAIVHHLPLPIDHRITLRHCLMNTCGLGDKYLAIPWSRLDPRIALDPRDIVALTLPQGQIFTPGDRFDYCNVGWVIAAMVLEHVTGKPHGVAVDELLGPLGLKRTQVGGEAPAETMLRGYIESRATGGMIDTSGCLAWVYGSGDGVSTLDDMLDLFAALAAKDNAIGISLADLTAATARPGDKPYVPLSIGTEYGLGLERRAWAGSEVWGHPGSTLAYLSGSWVDPARGVTVSTCVTRAISTDAGAAADLSYPRAQLFGLALATAYALADDTQGARHV